MYSSRPYQGYPYVNPMTTEAPSLTQEQVAAMARWANLPRTTVGGSKDRYVNVTRPATSKSKPESIKEEKEESEEEVPIVYIDMPDANGSGVSQRNDPPRPQTSKEDAPPMVYIDMPENGSEVSQSRDDEEISEHSFVQETIFYDPFKDRRIDGVSDGGGASSQPTRPPPPSSLSLPSAGSSGYNSIEASLPPSMSKESYVYGRFPTPDDGFRLSPLPVDDFPPPPPAYQEIDPRNQSQSAAQVPGNAGESPPRTQVIVTGYPTSPNPNRKYISCQYCHQQVHTLVIRESGIFTHALAAVCFVGCFPLVPLIYWTDVCKHQNHYCPNCNRCVAYEIPLICVDIKYTTNR